MGKRGADGEHALQKAAQHDAQARIHLRLELGGMTPAESISLTVVGQERLQAHLTVSAIVLALVAIRLVAAAAIPLNPDETYYFLWSRFPAWGYFDHPPMVAWWIAAGTALLGSSAIGIRVVSILSVIPTSLAIYAVGRALFNERIGLQAALWTNAAFLLAVGSVFATPDAPAVMFWTFAVLGLALLVRSGNPRWWLLIGLCSGLGVSAKLTDLFLGPGLLLLLLVRADLRKWLATPWPWAGGAIATAVVAPLLVWNEAHQWVTFTKQFGRLSVAELRPIHLPEFIGTQFGLLNPLLAILAGVAAAVAFRHRASDRGRAIGSLLIVTTPLLAYMTFHSIHGQVQGQWLAPLYPTLALAAAAGAEVRERWNQIAAAVLPTGVVATVVGFAAAINPTALIPPWLDVGNASRGWNDVASAAEALRASNGAAWIALTRYEPHAAVAYELRNRDVPVVAINERARYAFAPLPDRALLDQPALLLTTSPPSRFSGCFASLTAIQTVARRSGEAPVETYTAYLVTGASPDLFSRGCDGIRKRESDNALRPG